MTVEKCRCCSEEQHKIKLSLSCIRDSLKSNDYDLRHFACEHCGCVSRITWLHYVYLMSASIILGVLLGFINDPGWQKTAFYLTFPAVFCLLVLGWINIPRKKTVLNEKPHNNAFFFVFLLILRLSRSTGFYIISPLLKDGLNYVTQQFIQIWGRLLLHLFH